MLQKLPVGDFKKIKNRPQVNKGFKKNCNENINI